MPPDAYKLLLKAVTSSNLSIKHTKQTSGLVIADTLKWYLYNTLLNIVDDCAFKAFIRK